MVLTYHAFGPRRSVTMTDPSHFAETLAALIEAGYHGVALDDWIARGRPDEPHGFALTFDDGLRSLLQVAEIVASSKVPATIFVVAGRVGGDNAWPGQRRDVAIEPLLDWSELTDLGRLGFRFGAHGQTHARLDRLDKAFLEPELRVSRDTIEERLGRPCTLLAHPYGASSPTVQCAAARHYHASFGTRLDYTNAAQDRHNLSRIDAFYLRSTLVREALIAGRAQSWLRWRRVLREARALGGPLVPGGWVR